MLISNLANIITSTRIIGSIILVFTPVLSKSFFIVYVYSGVSDVLDGFVARKTKTVSNIGKKLDSVSDLLFYVVMMLKIMPFLLKLLPFYVWVIIYSILFVRVCIYALFGIKKHTVFSSHSIFNKATGCVMFLLPFLLKTNHFLQYSLFVCFVAIVAVLYDIYEILKNKALSH